MDQQAARAPLAATAQGVFLILIVLLTAMLDYLGFKYHARLDWTSSALYTLSEKTLNLLAALDRDVELVVLVDPLSPLYPAVTEMAARYEAASPRIDVEVVDPQRDPARARELVDAYEMSALDSVVVSDGTDRRVLAGAEMAEYDYTPVQYGQEPVVTRFLGEELISGAILELIEDRKPTILFLAGHGEARLDDHGPQGLSGALELLGRDNFRLEEWSALGQAAVPEKTDLVVVAAPRAPLLEQELDLLSRFLLQGGRVLVLAEPYLAGGKLAASGLEAWLAEYGIELGKDVVLDPQRSLVLFGAESLIVETYLPHPITATLDEAGIAILLQLARSVRATEPEEGRVQELFVTSEDGWGETNLVDLEAVRRDDDDVAGPVPLAVAATLPGPQDGPQDGPRDRPGRLVVVGDVDFASNAQLSQMGNPTLLLNILNWLAERERLLGIAPKEAREVRLTLSGRELRAIGWLVVVGMPLASLLLALLVHSKRRR